MRKGCISRRKRRERARRICRRVLLAGVVLLLSSMAMTPELRGKLIRMLERGKETVLAFADTRESQADLTLPQRRIYALAQGMYDNGETAALEAQSRFEEGRPCVVWQGEKMRLVSKIALKRENVEQGKDAEAVVFEEMLPKVALRLTSGERDMEEVLQLLGTPDAVLLRLLDTEGASLAEIVAETKTTAKRALNAHFDHELYGQLAQSLANWCVLMEQVATQVERETARDYAAATMCTLCRELRKALSAQPAAS